MLKYYLDKTGKVIKSILFPSSEFVDTEPREGSMNPVTSGGVAGGMALQSSNIAPNYTKKTYEANSYVMQNGVLYTNPNAIGTAEDWNPAHWTQTTVAEMMANIPQPQTGYTSVTRSAVMDTASLYKLDVGQKEVVTCGFQTVSGMATSTTLRLMMSSDVNDAIIVLTKSGTYRTRLASISSNTTKQIIYNDAFKHYETQMLDEDNAGRILLTTMTEEPSCGSPYPVVPNSFYNVETLYDYSEGTNVVTDISLHPLSLRSEDKWIIRVAGDYIFVDAQ